MRTGRFLREICSLAGVLALVSACEKALVKTANSNLRTPKIALLEVSSTKADASQGTMIAVPSDLAQLAGQLQIEQGSDIATQSVAASLQIGEGLLTQAGPSVNVSSQADFDPSQIGRLEISIPYDASASLLNSETVLVVIYQVLDADGKVSIGLIPSSDVNVGAKLISLKMVGFGNYQAARVPIEIKAPIKVVTEETKIITKEQQETLPALSIAALSPIIVRKGEQVTISGQNFRPSVKLAYLGRNISRFEVKSDQAIVAYIDDAGRRGRGPLYINQDGVETSLNLAYAGAADDFPLSTMAESEVCAGQKFYNSSGELKEGSKDCAGSPAPAACSSDGQGICLVDGTDFVAVAKANISASNIKSGTSIAGIAGTATLEVHSDCASDGATSCVATSTFKAAQINGLAAKVLAGQTVASIAGTATSETHSDCASDGAISCVATSTFKAAQISGLAAKVLAGQTVASIAGTAAGETHSDCASDGATSCVATSTFKAAQISGLAAKVLSGQTVASIAGTATGETHSDCASDGATSCVATSTFKAADTTGLAAKVLTGQTVASIAGTAAEETHSDCTSDGATACLATSTYRAAHTIGLAAKVLSGSTVASIAGTAAQESHSNCSSDGSTGCVATGSYPAAASSGLAAKVLSGQTVAGTSGTAPVYSACTGANQDSCLATTTFKTMDLSSAGATTDLTLTNLNATLASNAAFEFWDSTGVRHQANGSLELAPANIKSSISIFGVSGQYPSASHPLPSASATSDLTAATFNAQVKQTTAFEYWDSSGAHQTGNGDDDIHASKISSDVAIFDTTGSLVLSCNYNNQSSCQADTSCRWAGSVCELDPWNIRAGTSAGGVTGTLKTTCRNRINSSLFNTDSLPVGNAGATAGATNQWWDTIDDSSISYPFPTATVAEWTLALTDCSHEVWVDMTQDGTCNAGPDDCLFKDRISGLTWTESSPVSATATANTSVTWSAAVQNCNELSYAGLTDWRLPTQKELLEAYVHGMSQLAYRSGTAQLLGNILVNNDKFISAIPAGGLFWSATTFSTSTTSAHSIDIFTGKLTQVPKTTSSNTFAICVR